MNATEEQSYTIWVCRDCMHHHANGECGSCHAPEGHEGGEPLSMTDPRYLAAGMMRSKHRGENFCGDVDQCDCETDTFSRSSCEGCGSYLHGERHAMTVFEVSA
jgi:hypothetical protein